MFLNHHIICIISIIFTVNHAKSDAHIESDSAHHSPCDLVRCRKNTECVLQQVQCIQAPCNPVPVCKPVERSALSCANFKCQPKTICVLEHVKCSHGPCRPVPVCKPDPDSTLSAATCLNSICRDGFVCKMTKMRCSSTPCNPEPQCIPLPAHMSLRS